LFHIRNSLFGRFVSHFFTFFNFVLQTSSIKRNKIKEKICEAQKTENPKWIG